MNWQKKIAKLLSLICFALALASCDGNYCVEADEFDNDYVKVKSNPTEDGIFGTNYDNVDGGQVATWHETGLRANGQPFLIQISGSWIPWYGSAITDAKLNALSRCNFCAKKHNVSTENCICYKGQTPQPELDPGGNPVKVLNGAGVMAVVDCSIPANQIDPSKCTCTTRNGRVTDDSVFHFPLNFYKKDHSIRLPDDQGGACKYDAGLGLYLGLFGVSGSEMPIRVYHLFSEATVCPINRNRNGECKDESGVDQTKYVFRSANNAIFVKDDRAGNNGTDTNLDDNIYHKPNEFVKVIIYDRYYSDNYGQYNLNFLQGVTRDGDTGLLEFLVQIMEDALLGKKDQNLVRHGGIVQFMYKAIVQDTYFAATLQICLSIYIAFFGFSTLLGVVEISRKELLTRLIKLSLIIFFTTPTSWTFYNSIVVSFFQDGMNVLVSMFSDFVNAELDENNPIYIAKMVSPNTDTNASRFSYVDTMIKTMFSDNVTKKIWGLFFESFFGFIYIAAIYFLIGFFVYVMLVSAAVYVITLMKLIFVLALGPIFIAFSLFGQTEQMFKNWLGFIGARSLEMIIFFLILYTFVMFIDHKFTQMLTYRVCTHSINFGLFSFGILLAEPHRGFVEWIQLLLVLGGLIYILQEIVNKIPDLAGQLISIGGVGNIDDGAGNNRSAFKMAGAMMASVKGLAGKALSFGLSEGGGAAFRALRTASRASGISGAIDKVGNAIPVRGIRTRLRDNIIDDAIKKGKASAAQNGLKEGSKAFDNHVRNFVYNDTKAGLLNFKRDHKTKAALYDFSAETIGKRLDQKLVNEPLKKFLKDEAKKLKGMDPEKIPLGRDMERHMQEAANKWAEKNLAGGSSSIEGHLKDLKGFIKEKGALSNAEAAKKFAGNEELKSKFLQYKQEQALEKGKKPDSGTGKEFMRQAGYEEKRSNGFLDAIGIHTGKGWNPLARVGLIDRLGNRLGNDKLKKATDEAMAKAAADYLKKGGSADEKDQLRDYYKKKAAGNEDTFYGRQLLGKTDKNGEHVPGKLDKKLDDVEKKRDYFKQVLVNKIGAELKNKTDEEKEGMREEALKHLEEMKRRHEELLLDPDSPARMRANGGIEAYRDGLVDFNGSSLFEAKARAQMLGCSADSMGDSSTSIADAKSEFERNHKAMEERNREMEAREAEVAKLIEQGKIDEAKAKQAAINADASSSFPVEFGVNKLSDAIGLQTANFGLEAGNPLLVSKGHNDAGVNQATEALISIRNAMKSSAEREAKMKQHEAAFKEHEIAGLEADFKAHPEKAHLKREIDKARTEMDSLRREADAAERQAQNFERDITTLKNG